MRGDLPQILEVPLTPEGKIDITSLNNILRLMQERFFALEGRTQPSQVRNDLEVLGDVTAAGVVAGAGLSLAPAGTVIPAEVSVDGPLLSDQLGVLPYALPFEDNIGVEKDLLYPSPFSLVVREEFLGRGTTTGVIGELGWGLTLGTVTASNGVNGHVGVVTINTGAGPAVAPIFLSTAMPTDIRYIAGVMRFNAGTGAGSAARVGLLRTPTTAGTGSRGMYFHFNTIDNLWHTVTRDSVDITDVATTFTSVADEYQMFEIVLTASAVDFYINRRRTNRHTTFLETGVCNPAIVVEATGGAAAFLDVDTFCMVGPVGESPRWD